MTDATEPPGLHADARTYLAVGSEDEARAWLGRTVVRDAPYPVNQPEIGRFCAMVEDPDENHWPTDAARQRYGGVVSPPGMFMVWGFPLPWRPEGRPEHAPVLALEVPLPGTTLINVATTTDFTAPMRDGDLLSFRERLTDLSTRKTTPLGTGHFLTTVTDACRSDGTHVGTNENVMFRYQAAGSGDPPPQDDGGGQPRPAAPAAAGAPLPEVRLHLTATRTAAMVPAGTRDLFPGHHDAAYARSQGVADVYVNTMFLHGVVDRVGKAWAGPDAWLRRRRLRMHAPACVGTTLRTDGRVTARHRRDGRAVAELAIDVLADDRLAATSTLTLDLDGHHGAPT